jgi:hypothetical protein
VETEATALTGVSGQGQTGSGGSSAGSGGLPFTGLAVAALVALGLCLLLLGSALRRGRAG